MCLLTRYYEARCGWVWLGDGGRWQPVGLPGHPANPPKCGLPAEAPRVTARRFSVVHRRGRQFVEHVGDLVQDGAERGGQLGVDTCPGQAGPPAERNSILIPAPQCHPPLTSLPRTTRIRPAHRLLAHHSAHYRQPRQDRRHRPRAPSSSTISSTATSTKSR